MIEAKLKARLGEFQLDAELKSSGIMCLVGRNGAGKTSLLKAIAGLIRIDEGYVRIGTIDVARLPIEKRGVAMVTPNCYFPHLEVDSHIATGARLRGKRPQVDAVSKIKSELGIDFGGSVRNLSLGMRERVSLATALLASPRVILVDEAFSSLHGRDDFIAAYGRLVTEAGIDMIFTSQDQADGRLADQVYVMNNGSAKQEIQA